MSEKILTVGSESMEPGKFYTIQTNKDNVTALFEVKNISASAHYADFDTTQFNVDETTKKITLSGGTNSGIEGLDLSSLTKVYTQRVVASYDFVTTEIRVVEIQDFIIPEGVEFAVLSIHKIVNGTLIKESDLADYDYDKVTNILRFAAETNMIGRVIIEFYK